MGTSKNFTKAAAASAKKARKVGRITGEYIPPVKVKSSRRGGASNGIDSASGGTEAPSSVGGESSVTQS